MARRGREKGWIYIYLAALTILVMSCSPTARVGQKNPFYAKAVRLRQQQRYAEAADSFEQCLRLTPSLPEAHLQLAMLYDDHLQSPVKAIYHYERYLTLAPEGQNAVVARRSLRRVQHVYLKELAQRFNMTYEHESTDNDGNELERLRHEKEVLLERLKILNRRFTAALQEVARLRRSDTAGGGALPNSSDVLETYVVQKGDTLSDISRRFYGSANHWEVLKQYNGAAFAETDGILMPGMKLRIPPVDR